jgi:hypothetical protein
MRERGSPYPAVGLIDLLEVLEVQMIETMTDGEKKAALRFCDTCDDNEGYDVPRPMMKRLEALGLVIDKKFGRFEQTDTLLEIREALENWNMTSNAGGNQPQPED